MNLNDVCHLYFAVFQGASGQKGIAGLSGRAGLPVSVWHLQSRLKSALFGCVYIESFVVESEAPELFILTKDHIDIIISIWTFGELAPYKLISRDSYFHWRWYSRSFVRGPQVYQFLL